MQKTLILPLSLYSMLAWTCERSVIVERELAHWEYEHPNWEEVGYISCAGNAQSPIPIETAKAIRSTQLPALSFDYSPFNMSIVDNGHTIQVSPPSTNQAVFFNNVKYTFAQLHFHHHSEHQIDGKYSDMELHAVHKDADGNILVLTFMLQTGASVPLLKAIFDHIPTKPLQTVETDVSLDLNTLIPSDRSYFTYYGSLTTPPCTASVQFVVFKQPLTVTTAQIETFAKYHEANYRPLQPLNNRLVFEKPN